MRAVGAVGAADDVAAVSDDYIRIGLDFATATAGRSRFFVLLVNSLCQLLCLRNICLA